MPCQRAKVTSLILSAAVIFAIAHLADSSMTTDEFTLTDVRFCLRPEFIHDMPVEPGKYLLCARACINRGDDCRAFRLNGPTRTCQTMEFNRCSHMTNTDQECGSTASVYLRRQRGLPRGRLCPEGYDNFFYGSTYKFFDNASYTQGLSQCSSEPGQLTKFADAIDQTEMVYLHWLKNSVNEGRSYFAGGHRTGDAATGVWHWTHCGLPISSELWRPDEPNGGDSFSKANFWWEFNDTINDATDSHQGISQSLCECVDPFA